MKKRFLVGVLASLTIATSGMAMAGCNNNSVQAYSFANENELYSFSLITGMELGLTKSTELENKSSTNEFSSIVDAVHSFVPSFESFLGQAQTIIPQETSSDNEMYEKMLIVDYEDMMGNKNNYKLYFNETNYSEPIYQDQEEIVTKIEGVAIINDLSFSFDGYKEIENDEIETKFNIKMNDDFVVKIEQERENGEQEFVYSLYEKGDLVYSNAIELELENGKLKFEMEYETPIFEMELSIKKVENSLFEIEYEINDFEYKIRVEKIEEETQIKYVYSIQDLTITKILTK